MIFGTQAKYVKETSYVTKNYLQKKGIYAVVWVFLPQLCSRHAMPVINICCEIILICWVTPQVHLQALWKELAFTASFTSNQCLLGNYPVFSQKISSERKFSDKLKPLCTNFTTHQWAFMVLFAAQELGSRDNTFCCCTAGLAYGHF